MNTTFTDIPESSSSKGPDSAPQGAHIVIADQFDRPVVVIRACKDVAGYESGPRQGASAATMTRLGSLLQAVPSLLTAGESARTQLMEVVVNGDLVRAADGSGFRAMTMGPKGVREHARLFSPDKLKNIINATAIWQVASVVVAQQHLAEISKKLTAISEGVTRLSSFLDEQRRARIEGAFRYLQQAHMALEAGEMSKSVRTEIESCERTLLEVQGHLCSELRRELSVPVPHTDAIGTDELARGISQKIRKLDAPLQDLALCIRTRICAWHVLSLFPGEPVLMEARANDIRNGIRHFGQLASTLEKALWRDIANMNSPFNSESTLQRRRNTLKEQAAVTARKILATETSAVQSLDRAAARLSSSAEPVRVLLRYNDGILEGATVSGSDGA